MRKVLLTFLLLCVFFAYEATAQSCTNNRYLQEIFTLTEQSNIDFGTSPALVYPPYVAETTTYNQDLRFDLYQPTGDTLTKRPLIIMAFGGAFVVGFKEQPQLVDFCRAMARRGYVVASIDYRLGHNLTEGTAIRAVYRAVQDVKSAIRFFKGSASYYKIDTSLVFTGGNSAGSIASIHASYVEESEILGLPLFADVYGGGVFGNWPNLGCLECTGNAFTTNGEATAIINFWGAISDLDFISSSMDQPMISFHGADDLIVLPDAGTPFSYPFFPTLYGSIPMHDKLNALGVVNELNLYPGEGHELWLSDAIATEMQEKTADFLYELMKSDPLSLSGPTDACLDLVATYTVQNRTGSSYCWDISGGQILSSDQEQNTITVEWDAAGSYSVSVREINRNVVEGDLVSLNVNVGACQLQASAMLEGPLGNGTQMTTELNTGGLIPLTQPFNRSPWNYTGSESLNTVPANMTDWILVELVNTSDVVQASRAAVLNKDGSITDVTGSATLEFRGIPAPQNCHIVLKSRGHLGVVSNLVSLGNGLVSYDFSTSLSQAVGTAQQVATPSGAFALKAGDIDSNGAMTFADFNKYMNNPSAIYQYLDADLNLDRLVTVADYNLYKKNASSVGMPLVQYP